MRISRDPADKAYSTERAQVWVNDSEITDWLTADDFRRSVIARDGRVINGSVRIVILPPGVESAEPPSAPVAGHLLGVVEHVPDAPPPAPAPKPEERHGGKRRR